MRTPPSTPKPPQTVANLEFTLDNLLEEILSGTIPDKLRNLVNTARDTITKSSSIPLPIVSPVSPANLFFTSNSISSVANQYFATSKIDRVLFVAFSSGVMTYTGPLDFLDS